MIVHYAIGAVLAALLALAMMLTDQRIFQSIVSSSSPLLDLAMFFGLFSFFIGIGAMMTGFIFSMIELNALQAKQRIQTFKRRNDSES